MSAINNASHPLSDLASAFAVAAGVHSIAYELTQRFFQLCGLSEKEARPIAIVAITIGLLIGMHPKAHMDKMLALACLVGIAASAIFAIWSYQRSQASE